MKQTAVDWLYEILTTENWEYKTYEEQNEIFQKAKQVEKDQIMDAYGQGIVDEAGEILDVTKDAEQYYKETHGK
jgi:hypothetical protein